MENSTRKNDLPIPVSQVIELELAFEGTTLTDQDRAWMGNMALDLTKHCWPSFIEALNRDNSAAILSYSFVDSFTQSTKHFIDKAENLGCVLVTQPRAVITDHPSKGSQKVWFTLNVYWRQEPPPSERTSILLNDQTCQVIPEISG
ncbi:MAG: hypothetical protein H0S79_11035 [Anaerolineaceae bacterium]|nr:hypothetical protein [Anaerolineaceae bacterium]